MPTSSRRCCYYFHPFTSSPLLSVWRGWRKRHILSEGRREQKARMWFSSPAGGGWWEDGASATSSLRGGGSKKCESDSPLRWGVDGGRTRVCRHPPECNLAEEGRGADDPASPFFFRSFSRGVTRIWEDDGGWRMRRCG